MESKKDLDLTKSIQIISFEEDGTLKLQSNAIKFFQKHLKTPCAFVSIIGPVRQGKSLLLNLIIGNLNPQSSSGRFSMSNGLESHTRGVFIYPTPIENGGISYYFLDCQGKENKKEEDIRVFTLMCLISSLCIFQTMKTLTYDHDFLLPYLKSRKYIKEVLTQDPNYSEQTLIINPNLKLLFLVRDCPDSKKAEVSELFQKVFIDYEDYQEENDISGNRSLKQIEVNKRNTVRQLLKEEFNLSDENVFNLPYYLDKIEENYKWKQYNEEVKEEVLSKSFKQKVDILVKNHIIGHVRPLGYIKKRGVFLAIRGEELARVIALYVKMINENKVNNIFDEMELLLLKVKEEVMSLYTPNIPKIFENSEHAYTQFNDVKKFEDYYHRKFDKLIESFEQEVEKAGRKNQIEIPNIKQILWIEELEKNFKLLLEKEVSIFKKELEIQRIKREEEERKRREEEERLRLRLIEEERKRLIEEERLRLIEEERKRLIEEERRRLIEEERKRLIEEERRRLIEEERRRLLEEKEKERRRLEEQKRIEDLKRIEDQRRKEEEERRILEEEARQQEEITLQRLQREQEEEFQRRQLEESKMNIENTLNHSFGMQKPQGPFLSEISSISARKPDLSMLSSSEFVGDVSLISNVSPEDAKRRLAEFDESQLKYTKKGILDMRFNVNKNYHNLMVLSRMEDDINSTILKSSRDGVIIDDILLPRNLDGTLDLRFNKNKEFLTQSMMASQENSQFDN